MNCIHCGQAMPKGAEYCHHCGGQQPRPASYVSKSTTSAVIDRPGGLTAFILFFVGINFLSSAAALRYNSIISIITFGIVLIIAVGLWNLKQWGRWAFIAVQSFQTLYLIATFSSASPARIISIIVSIALIVWLLDNGKRFN